MHYHVVLSIFCRSLFESTNENAELANALLSLGQKHTLPDSAQPRFESNFTYQKPGFLPLSSSSHQSFAVPTVHNNNGWIGGPSTSIPGCPFPTLIDNRAPICSCSARYSKLISFIFHILHLISDSLKDFYPSAEPLFKVPSNKNLQYTVSMTY